MTFVNVCVDPGHGGHDSGAVGPGGTMEKSVVRNIAHHLLAGLDSCGFGTMATRTSDEFISLQQRCDIANRNAAGLFLSIHANACVDPAAGGFEVWTSPGYTKADDYATAIFNQVRQTFPKLRGRVDSSDSDPDKESHFYVLMHTNMPAVLIETAFISNPTEERWLLDPGWSMRMAGAVVSALWQLRGGVP